MRNSACLAFLVWVTMGAATVHAETPKVVASVKPVHSLVSAIMRDIGEPSLIVDGVASPHTFSLKPSGARMLQDADIVFWIGDGLEVFLQKPLQSLTSKASVVKLEDAPGLEKLPLRQDASFDHHSHGEEHDHSGHGHGHGHENEAYDTHLWLDPKNAKAFALEIERSLISIDPGNAARYRANGADLQKKIDDLDAELEAALAPVRARPFVVFHDAYQYLERRYRLSAAGSITMSPDIMPGAERVRQIRSKIRDLGAACVFSEPQFNSKLMALVTEGTAARSGTLDPEASTLRSGPDLYFEMMRGLAHSLHECLGNW